MWFELLLFSKVVLFTSISCTKVVGQNVEPFVLVLENISTQIVRDVSTKRLIFGWKNCLFTKVILDDRHVGYQTTSVFVNVILEIEI